jgi:two-component system sensor histidine kinase KdpD
MLARAAAEEARAKSGRLKIFFGASPGVGKTYAMLEAAQAAKREGADVIIGWIETHARPETDALTRGLDRLPPRQIEYRGIKLSDFDLDLALKRRPQLLIVDELAHTNAPTLRHARRWQDVEELLESGIDVWTTLNVQHVESLNDVVAQITGVVVRETVPDSLLERAEEIELVDLPPDDLLRRLREGKVYVPKQAEHALSNFFVKGNLIALRELALRRTAERVDAQVTEWKREHGISKTWPTRERILVAVGPAPQSANLARAAFRMADRMRAPWIALSVETPSFNMLPAADRERTRDHLELAQELGAEAVVVRGESVVEEILRVARDRNVTRIVVGKPTHPRWRDRLRGSLVDELVRISGGIDVLVTTGDETHEPAPARQETIPASWTEYVWAASAVLVVTALSWVTRGIFDLVDQAMFYLLGVLLVAMRASRVPALLTAAASVAAFDFFFVPPIFTFSVADLRYLLTFAVMLVVGVAVSSLTLRIREQAEAARQRERRTSAANAMARELAAETEVGHIAGIAVKHIEDMMEAPAVLILADRDRNLSPLIGGAMEMADERELAVARWAFEHRRAAGFGTDTLPASALVYLPLIATKDPLGVFGVALGKRKTGLSPSQEELLHSFLAQTALTLERAVLAEEAERARIAVETERTRNALLSAVSHDLRTPLASITGSAGALLDEQAPLGHQEKRELLETIHDEATRLARLVGDLLDLTRLESGNLRAKKEWYPLEEVIGSALARSEKALSDREVTIDLPKEMLLIPVDAVLVQQVFINLLDNAAKFSKPGTPIEIRAMSTAAEVRVQIADHGPGLPPGE